MNKENSNPFSILKELKFENLTCDDSVTADNNTTAPVSPDYSNIKIRVWLDKKKRKGKTVSLIKGMDIPKEELSSIAKLLKKKLGAGGSVFEDHILIQSQNRDEIIRILVSEGFKDVLKAGS